MKKILILLLLIIFSSTAYAAGEIVQFADKLNYWNGDTHTVTITNTGALSTQVTVTRPSYWSFGTLSGCSFVSSTVISCNIGAGSSVSYQLSSNSSDIEYLVTTVSASTNNSYTANDVKFLKIKDSEIFHTLVEYGRGRGNYFFDSMGAGLAGSGHTGSGCAYLPNGTLFELNFLHKILNIQQYFGFANADAENASFTCTYPESTVVREHLVSNILRSSGLWIVDYLISRVSGSWERMGYIGMNFDIGEYSLGQNISINCSGITYTLPAAGGNISIDEDSFDLEIRDREPFNVSALTATGTVGNGTQEVIISYTITNNEVYDVDNVIIEIEAPQYATFIGTRGELWGVGRDQFRIEKTELLSGQSETIELVARFDTTNAPNITSLDLSQGVKVQYVTCWEANAYNPQEYMQYVNVPSTVSVNMGVPTNIVNIIDLLTSMNVTLNQIYTTTNLINITVSDIWNLTIDINQSIANLPYRVWNFYSRNLTYYPPVAAYNITVTGGVGGAGGGVACRWNQTQWYQSSFASSSFIQVYGTNWARVDYPGLYTGAVDLYRTCYRVAPTSGTAAAVDVLEVYLCNDYDGSGNPETEVGCTLIDVLDVGQGSYVADQFKWECADILGKEVYGTNVSIMLECDACAGTADGWKVAQDILVNSTYSYNSTNDGTSWNLESNESLVEWDWCVPIDFGYDVWHYENRSLTENVTCAAGACNISQLLDQFNCTNGAATNKLCEVIFAINETSTNMWNTIQIMNSTLNNVWNYSQLIYGDTQIIIDLLNCNGTVDSLLCNITLDLNQSVNQLTITVNNINNTVNSINNTLYVMNQTITNQFNYTWSLINNITVDVGNLSISLNCSDPINNFSDSVCAYVQRIETNTVNINNTVNDILNVVNYINGTRWGNVTAWDLYQAILNISNVVTNNLQEVLTAITRLREFDEELVFLVTDAFGLQQSANRDLDNGDFASAADKLRDANDRLNEAAMRLVTTQNEVSDQAIDGGSGFAWVLAMVGFILILSLGFYLFSRPKA